MQFFFFFKSCSVSMFEVTEKDILFDAADFSICLKLPWYKPSVAPNPDYLEKYFNSGLTVLRVTFCNVTE